MIDVKEAVKSSARYLQSMQAILEMSIHNVLLEEVEVSDDDEHWLITLGYDYKLSNPTLEFMENDGLERKYKKFKVDRENGEVESMKNVSI